MDNKRTFTVELDGTTHKFAVVKPTPKQQTDAQKVHSKAFRDAIEAGALVRACILDVMRKQGLWNDEKEKLDRTLERKLNAGEYKLTKGGLKFSEAKAIALQMRKDRAQRVQLASERNSLDLHTAEAQAENARFNYLVSACTVDTANGRPRWESFEQYMATENDPVAQAAAEALGKLVYNLEDDWRAKLPENKLFLLKYKLVDKDMRLLDKDGHWVDEDGKRLNDKGQYVDQDGHIVDEDGRPLNEDGTYKVDFAGFFDDDGQPIPEPEVNSPTLVGASV